jgi:membrane protein implicated in regulation of membrane protease activity
MSPETVTLIWLGAGLAMMIAEAFLPGGIVIFLGAAATLVAGARWVGLIESLTASFGTWLVLSLAMVLGLRSLVVRFSSPEKTVQPTDEDLDAFGREVEVVATITEEAEGGRIRYHGTSWPARSLKGTLPAGSIGRIVHRDNLSYIVEPVVSGPGSAIEKQKTSTPIKGGA